MSDPNDLITVTRACNNAKLAALNISNPVYLTELITSSSSMIHGNCARLFNSQSYSEYYDALNFPFDFIQLRQYPVTQVQRLATNPQQVISITNNDTTNNQFAEVVTTLSGFNTSSVTISWLASGVSNSQTFSAASYVTLQSLATAISAVGGGWTSTVYSGYGNYATATLRPYQGNMSALGGGGAWLEMYLDTPTFGGNGTFLGYQQTGVLTSGPQWRLDPVKGVCWGCFPGGQQGIRVDYTAGFATIPQDLQQACMRLCVLQYERDLLNSTVQTGRVGPFSETKKTDYKGYMDDPEIKSVCFRYRDNSKFALT
jgi:hypothetical protein